MVTQTARRWTPNVFRRKEFHDLWPGYALKKLVADII
jgi:hypothetical protein